MKIYQFYLVVSIVNASKKKIVKRQAEKYKKYVFIHYIVARICEEDITEIKTPLQLGDSFISEISKHN